MTKFNKYLVRVVALLLVVSMMLPFAACRKNNEEQPTEPSATVGAVTTYTVQIQSVGGMALSGVGVYVYEDETLAELVWFDQTDAEGKMTFTDVARDTYVAVLSDVPTGYAVEDFYPITGELTQIILQAGKLDEENIGELTYKLGDMMMDFTITGPDGTEYTLSELLKQKKAVVLNFWYVECGPCKAEFPFLQEAYEKYSEDIALLALNPINTAEEITAFQKENGYTFPMLSCGIEWEKLMGLTAYPTTVVIDRFGNICLIHKGSIDSAKTFEDTFAYFAADEYEQKLIEDIKTLETEEEEGSKENPKEVGGKANFEVEVEPGKEVFTEIYKATGMYMSIWGENNDFYVLYNDKKYTPDSSGIVGFVVTTGDNYTPAVFGIGNTSTQTQKFGVSLSFLPGTFNNPYSMKLGEFTVSISAGNDQGVNYVWYAPESGKLTLQCLKASSGINYGYTLYNTDTMAVRSLEADGGKDDAGVPTLSVTVNKGDRILFTASTLPDESFNYPAGKFTFLASFEAGEGTKIEKIEKIDYTVTVTDEAGKPLKDVSVWLNKDGKTASAKTDDKGVVTMNLEKGTYTGSISIPEGYTLENNSFELTEKAPTATIKLAKAVDTRVSYTVKVLDPAGNPVKGAEILILGVDSAVTGSKGTVTFTLEAGKYTALVAALPEGYVCEEVLTLTEKNLSGTFRLQYALGTKQNPIMLTQLEENIFANEGTLYYGTTFDRMIMEISGPAGFKALIDGKTVKESGGKISQKIIAADANTPVVFAITGDGDYSVSFTYPQGHQTKPVQMVLGTNKATLDAGDPDYYFNWTSVGNGELTITMDAAAQWRYSISNLTTGETGQVCKSDDATPAVSQTVKVSTGDLIQVTVNTYDKANKKTTPAGTVTFDASFLWTVDVESFTEVQVGAGESKTYRIDNASRRILTVDGADAWVSYNETTYEADSNGQVIVLLGKEESPVVIIGNQGTEGGNFPVSFSWPEGSRYNPTILDFSEQAITTILENGDDDGHYYKMIANEMGWLTFIKQSFEGETDYTIDLDLNDGQQTAAPEEGDETKSVTLRVYPDDVILLHVQSLPTEDGAYVDAVIINGCTFVIDTSIFTVTYDANGGTLTGEAEGYTVSGKLPEMAAAPILEGYDFLGWFDAVEGGNQITTATAIPGDMTVYAHWALICTVTYDANGGTLSGDATVTTVGGKLPTLPTAPVRSGWEFVGWFDAATDGNQITTDTVIPTDMTVYAQWNPIYTLTFDANGGTLTGNATVKTVGCKLPAMPANPVRTGWEFLGWFDAATGGKQVTTDTVFKSNGTIYAHWQRIEYTVTFQLNGGSMSASTTAKTVSGKLSSLPTPTRDQYTFLGWFDAATGGNKITTDKVYTTNTTIYAQWKSNVIIYEVEVVDEQGAAVTSGVTVTWLDSAGTPVSTKAINNASGTVSASLTPGTYTITLNLSGTYKDYKYDTAAVQVTKTKPAVTIRLAKPISSSAAQNNYETNVGKMVTKDVPLGATYVVLNSSQKNYAVLNGTKYCFFRYLITEQGTYSFTTSNGAPISNWGTSSFFIADRTSEEQREANCFDIEIYDNNIPKDEGFLPLFFAVEVTSENPNTILLIENSGKVSQRVTEDDYVTYKGTQTPAVTYNDQNRAVAIAANIFKLETGGKSLTYVDMLNDKAVKGDDGYYHLNSKTGPVLYVNLGENAPYISMAVLTGAIGQYGTGFKKVFKNPDGSYVLDSDGTIKAEDYTSAMIAYSLHVDKNYGVYPLTDDLVYMLQNGGEYKGWYTPGDGNYLFTDQDIEVDLSLAWMFAVCYLK